MMGFGQQFDLGRSLDPKLGADFQQVLS